MVGDGSVVKRRMRQGNGEFPIDCPIEDTTVWLHYRVRRLDVQPRELLQQSTGGDTPWVLDSRTQGQKGDGEAAALEVDTGEVVVGCMGRGQGGGEEGKWKGKRHGAEGGW